MIDQFFSKQFLIFLINGGTAALVNVTSRIFYNQWIDFSLSVVLAYITGMITAFVLTKLFVFKESQQGLRKSAVFFMLVNLIAVLQTWGISVGLASYLLPYMGITRFIPEIAHVIGVVVPVFTSYVGHKHFSFR